jgi:hypothetical protein
LVPTPVWYGFGTGCVQIGVRHTSDRSQLASDA